MSFEDLEILVDCAIHMTIENANKIEDVLLSDLKFCKEYRTVRIALHRQIGHTTYIKKHSKNKDFIYTTHPSQYLGFSNVCNTDKDKSTCNQFDELLPETIWVDNTSFFTDKELNKIYVRHARDCSLEKLPMFVLLG